MDRTNPYYRQVELLVRVLPHVAKHECFALKGGTAINLFVRKSMATDDARRVRHCPLHRRAVDARYGLGRGDPGQAGTHNIQR